MTKSNPSEITANTAYMYFHSDPDKKLIANLASKARNIDHCVAELDSARQWYVMARDIPETDPRVMNFKPLPLNKLIENVHAARCREVIIPNKTSQEWLALYTTMRLCRFTPYRLFLDLRRKYAPNFVYDPLCASKFALMHLCNKQVLARHLAGVTGNSNHANEAIKIRYFLCNDYTVLDSMLPQIPPELTNVIGQYAHPDEEETYEHWIQNYGQELISVYEGIVTLKPVNEITSQANARSDKKVTFTPDSKNEEKGNRD